MILHFRRYAAALLLALCAATVAAQGAQGGCEGRDAGLVAEAADTARSDTMALQREPAWPLGLQGRLARLVGSELFERSQVGLMVYDLTADSALFCHNERQTLRPASTMKVITAIAAIDCLGGSYQLRTQLRYSGHVEDGTLRGRMRGTFAAGNVRAKTGSVAAISSLAGYCTAANGHVLCFAIINQGLRRGSEGRAFQDRVCNELCRP